jgi:hypothetical protein
MAVVELIILKISKQAILWWYAQSNNFKDDKKLIISDIPRDRILILLLQIIP